MIKLFTIYVFLMLGFGQAYGQKLIKDFVSKNTDEILAIHPDSTNYDDLHGLGNAIGDATIVMLGEQDHGDAPTFLAKTRIIKYLHEIKGFNVLAFESDFFALNEGMKNIKTPGIEMDSFIAKNITPLWTRCEPSSDLFFKYMPSTSRSQNPLLLTGFDNQIFFAYSSKFLYPKLDSALTASNIPITKDSSYRRIIFPLIKEWYNYSKDPISFYKIQDYLNTIKTELSLAIGSENFWVILIENLLSNNRIFRYNALGDKVSAEQARDSIMAKNLHWLVKNKFAGEKIIVWAANSHIYKFSGKYPFNNPAYGLSMGAILNMDSSINRRCYTMGFTSLKGTAGRISSKRYELKPVKKNSFESWIDKNYKYAFVDFKKFNTESEETDEEFYMSGLGHQNISGIWTRSYDGVFFIRDMYSCTDVP